MAPSPASASSFWPSRCWLSFFLHFMRPGGPFFPLQTSSICIGSDLCYLFFPSSFPFLIFCSLSTLAISSFPISFNYKINQVSELISEFQLVLLTAGSFRNTSSSAYSKPNSSSFLHLYPNLTSCWWDGFMSWEEHKARKWEDMDSTLDTPAVNLRSSSNQISKVGGVVTSDSIHPVFLPFLASHIHHSSRHPGMETQCHLSPPRKFSLEIERRFF